MDIRHLEHGDFTEIWWNNVRVPHVTATYKLYLTAALSAQAGEMPALFTLHSHWVSVVHFTDDGVGILVGTGFWAIGVGTMLVVSSTEYTQWIAEKETETLISIQMQVLKCQFYSHAVVQEVLEPFLNQFGAKLWTLKAQILWHIRQHQEQSTTDSIVPMLWGKKPRKDYRFSQLYINSYTI